MANTRSALKDIRKIARRRVRNRLVRTSARTQLKRAQQGIESGGDNVESEVKDAVRALDKAAAKGIIHKNAAARRKSRLIKKLRSRTTTK